VKRKWFAGTFAIDGDVIEIWVNSKKQADVFNRPWSKPLTIGGHDKDCAVNDSIHEHKPCDCGKRDG
jgi:hypothetical protein